MLAFRSSSAFRTQVQCRLLCGYSPERINPGDKQHTVAHHYEVTSGSTPEAADAVDKLYAQIIRPARTRAASIEVADAAKVIENTQRDLNIALMNELAIIFQKLGLDTKEVLAAAGTKWNFLPFTRVWSAVTVSASIPTT